MYVDILRISAQYSKFYWYKWHIRNKGCANKRDLHCRNSPITNWLLAILAISTYNSIGSFLQISPLKRRNLAYERAGGRVIKLPPRDETIRFQHRYFSFSATRWGIALSVGGRDMGIGSISFILRGQNAVFLQQTDHVSTLFLCRLASKSARISTGKLF